MPVPEPYPEFLQAVGLHKRYEVRRSRQGKKSISVLSDINLSLQAGGRVALVGRSGSGKSTLARCLALLEAPTGGSVIFNGRDLLTLSERQRRPLRRKIQLIFQDPGRAVNPRFTVEEAISEPLLIAGGAPADNRVEELMVEVGLDRSLVGQSPLALSGGQRQRLVIARALALQPQVLILDEAFSGLDLSLQAQVVNLLLDLQQRHAMSYLFISHDLSLVELIADHAIVLDQGRVVEQGPPAVLLSEPKHAQTRALAESMRLLARGR
jgi:peptide/nickel transport system ATP-binding protein